MRRLVASGFAKVFLYFEMSQKLVSVIIPTFNRARLVAEAVRSAQAQSYDGGAVQIIVIDDGSSDDTRERIAEFENVEYYFQPNKGQAAARNLGLSHARGDYIASLDSDDVWHKDFLRAAVAAIERFDANFVFLNWTEISDDEKSGSGWERGEIWRRYFKDLHGEWSLLDHKQARSLFLETCPAPSSALLIRRSSFVSGWNEEMKIADDWCLILEMVVTRRCRAAFTMSHYWTKRVHTTNIYHGREEIDVIRDLGLHDEPLLARFFKGQLSFAEKTLMKKRLISHYFNFGRLNLKRDGFTLKHFRSFADAFRLAPVGSIFYVLKLSFYSLKNRYRIARNK